MKQIYGMRWTSEIGVVQFIGCAHKIQIAGVTSVRSEAEMKFYRDGGMVEGVGIGGGNRREGNKNRGDRPKGKVDEGMDK